MPDRCQTLLSCYYILGQQVSEGKCHSQKDLLLKSNQYRRSICLYGFNYTVPTIIRNLGYSSANAQLLTVPLYIFGMITTIICSILSDRMKIRWPFVVGPYIFSLLGFVGTFPSISHTAIALTLKLTMNPRPPRNPPPRLSRPNLRPSVPNPRRWLPTAPHLPRLAQQ